MKKSEAIEKARKILSVLENLPNNQNIDINAIDIYSEHLFAPPYDIKIYFYKGLEDQEPTGEERSEYEDRRYIHKHFVKDCCVFWQVFEVSDERKE